MTIASTDTAGWAHERSRWTRFYTDHLPQQLRQAIRLAASSPVVLRRHFETFLALLNATAHREDLTALWLDLVDRLHPHPVRWGEWSAWLEVLRQAAARADESGRHAGYLAFTAELLLDTGRLDTALETTHEAMRLARLAGAAWPLCAAGSTAAAILRTQARYDDAQTVIDEVRDAAARMPAVRPASRAAMGTALLDLEQMDLLRIYGRPEEAISLGEQLIARLSTVPGIDPHDLATAYLRRATLTWAADRYQPAADDLQHAAALYRRAGDELQAVFAEANLGTVYLSMSRYRDAEALKLAAIRAAEEVNARHILLSELGDLGVIYIGMGRMEQARDYADRMVKLAVELGNEAELSRGRGNRGYTLLALGHAAEAWEDIEFSLNRYRAQGRREGMIVTTIDLVMYLRSIGDEAGAARLARENYDAARRENFPKLHIVTARCLALFLPVDEQRALLGETLALARAHGRRMDEAGCLFALSAIEDDPQLRAARYQAAVDLLIQMGATGWLVRKSPAEPPLLPMMI